MAPYIYNCSWCFTTYYYSKYIKKVFVYNKMNINSLDNSADALLTRAHRTYILNMLLSIINYLSIFLRFPQICFYRTF